ncbi:hypothetical protein [Mycobacterium szulgai]
MRLPPTLPAVLFLLAAVWFATMTIVVPAQATSCGWADTTR